MSKLVLPSAAYEVGYRQADAERGRDGSAESFVVLLRDLADEREGRLAAGEKTTELWLVEDDDYIGKVRIRHSLDQTTDWRGHVGCMIRPSRRRQGHATRLLGLALPHLFRLGIEPALVTCEPANVASRKLIARYGGTLVDEVAQGPNLPAMLRFWMPTRPKNDQTR